MKIEQWNDHTPQFLSQCRVLASAHIFIIKDIGQNVSTPLVYLPIQGAIYEEVAAQTKQDFCFHRNIYLQIHANAAIVIG